MPRRTQQENERYKELVSEYKRLAKRADQRLVRLEKLAAQDGFENVTQYAYHKAMVEIRGFSGEGANRFNRNTPKTIPGIVGKINTIRQFLDSVTSTKSGINIVYDKKAKTLNDKYKKYGMNFTWEDMQAFFQSELNEKMDELFTSDQKMKIIATLHSDDEELLEKIRKGNYRSLYMRTGNSKLINQQIRDFMKENGKEISSLMPGI